MVTLVNRIIHLNNNTYSTSQNPIGIGVAYSHSSYTEKNSVGYFMGSYQRPLSVSGAKSETMFWEYCKECPLYLTRQCTGGYRVLSSDPRVEHVQIQSANGTRQVKYYNKEFCKLHYNTDQLRNDLNRPATVVANLLPHFFTLRGATNYWYLFRPNSQTNKLEFLPYQIFNTYGSGEICYGGSNADRCSLPQRYEGFFNARVNTDLMPVSMPLVDWIRSFTPEALMNAYSGNSSFNWKDHQDHIGTMCLDVVPAVFDMCVFLSVSKNTIPEFLRTDENYHNNSDSIAILPLLRKDGQWVVSSNINSVITEENYSVVRSFLRREIS